MKGKIFACFVAAALLAAGIPTMVSAEDPTYTDIDYTQTVTLGEPTSYTHDGDDPYIELQTPDWQGYAKGYTVTLEADKLYLITAAVTEPEADYTDRCVSILTGGELTGSEEDDLIMYKTGYADGPSCTTTLLFRPEAAGDYRILAHGYATTDLGEVGGTCVLTVSELDTTEGVAISTKQELLNFAAEVNENGQPDDATVIRITADIDMTGEDWDGIGRLAGVYIFGGGHTVTGLGAPLVQGAEAVVIDGLHLRDIRFEMENESGDLDSIGGFIGEGDGVTLQGCSVTGRIQLTAENVYAVGGLAGYLDYSTVTDCSADVELVLKAAEEIGYAGGLAGYVDYDSAFAGCTASGSIQATAPYMRALGGLAGYFEDYNTVRNSHAGVAISAAAPEGGSAEAHDLGGLLGSIDESNRFVNSYASGGITVGDEVYGNNIGGFVGDSSCCGGNLILNCYALGDVEGAEDVGGFFGEAYEYDFFINCYAAGSVAYKEPGATPGDTPVPYIGAFIGYTDYPDKLDFVSAFAAENGGLPLFWSYDGDADVALEDVIGLDTLDFSSAPAVGEMLDAFNEIVGPYGEEFREELFRWAGSNEKNGPVFANLTVTFVDDDDTVIKTVTEVYAGEDITSKAPALPSRDGFTTAWDRDFTNVQESMTVQAVYTEIPEPPSSDPGSGSDPGPTAPGSPDTGVPGSTAVLLLAALSLAAVSGLTAAKRKKVGLG